IGVCTIDQVLISVLPVKHRFIRGLGIGRSVLIVDEVHAYDTYMNGLLEAVLKAQADVGGSVILLSATLPMKQKQKLLDTWRGVNGAQRFDLLAHPEQLPPRFSIQPEPIYLADMLPDLTMLERMIAAANAGAQACLICNLVDVAQVCYQRLKELNNTQVDIDLFHARFTLNDRREKENRVIINFGKHGKR
ncbi:CRISPR-associated helicase Cas3', partial [Escherichia coli]|uniref:CRISPR-associated helicase Cas3' n=1 Tax=Escherichia coli TaxID=562 RepID=UPI00136D0C7F